MPRLVLSNVPAKLGEPVLRKMLPALAMASDYVAIVIVAPLRHLLEESAAMGQIEILPPSGLWRPLCVPLSPSNWGHADWGENGIGLGPVAKLYKRGELALH